MPDGGFAETPGGDSRPDATAWAALCLEAFQSHPEIADGARARLAAGQLPNGSIPLSPDYPEAFWPTAAAAIALNGHSRFSVIHDKTIAFLLEATGLAAVKDPDAPLGHDSTIPGWSWIDQTHSWVEPTAMAMRALSQAGKSAHERVRSGTRLLLDRQLPGGGWNYGNTTVYGKTLNAMPASTGMALWSLAGMVGREQVAASIDLLLHQLPTLRTPLSLGWALHGLSAWEAGLRDADTLIVNCLERRDRHGVYGTSQLGILLLAAASRHARRASDG